MKQLFRHLLLLALVLSSVAHAAQAQARSKEYVLDEQGNPIRIRHEIIVRFDPLSVKPSAVNNILKFAGPLADFVQSETVEQLSTRIGQNLSGVPTFKIFRNLTTLDTVSIGRDGVPVRLPPLWSAFVLRLPDWLDEKAVCDEFNQAAGLVEYAHFNEVPRPADTNPPRPRIYDPLYGTEQASLNATVRYPEPANPADRFHVNVQPAWRYVPFGNAAIKVGVMDTGIDYLHPDFGDGTLANSRVRGGWDYVNQQPLTFSTDNYNHGTACAGIIGALRNNQDRAGNYVGIAGIASGVSLYSLRIFGGGPNDVSFYAGLDQVAEGILDAALSTGRTRNYGVHVMNHSWGGSPTYLTPNEETLLSEVVKAAYYSKVVMVGIRHNYGNNLPIYPANYPTVISVSATGRDGLFKNSQNGEPNNASDDYTSNYGAGVDIAAPGTQALVYTLGPGGIYQKFNGTSAAAPHVAGAAALLLTAQNAPSHILCPEDVEQVLTRTALPKLSNMPGISPADLYGAGLLDVGRAVSSTVGGAYLHLLAGTDATAQRTVVAGSASAPVTLELTHRAGNLASGVYRGEVIRSVVTAAHNLTGLNITGSWARSSASAPYGYRLRFKFFSFRYMVEPYPNITLDAASTTSATLTGYFYHVTGTAIAPGSLDVWLPYNPALTTGNYAYTIWTYDPYYFAPRMSPGDPGSAPAGTAARAYPNPSRQEAWVDFVAQEAGERAALEVRSLTGQTLAAWPHTAAAAGRQTEPLPLAKLPAGLYICRITTPAGVSVVRVTKE